MSLASDIIAHLRGDGRIMDLIDRRVFHGLAPSDVASPFAVITTAIADRMLDLSGDTTHEQSSVVIEVFNESGGGTFNVESAIIASMDDAEKQHEHTKIEAVHYVSRAESFSIPVDGEAVPVDIARLTFDVIHSVPE